MTLDNVVRSPQAAGTNLTSEALVADGWIDSIPAVARGEGPAHASPLDPEVLHARRRAGA